VKEYIDRVEHKYPALDPNQIWNDFCDFVHKNIVVPDVPGVAAHPPLTVEQVEEDTGVRFMPNLELGGEENVAFDANLIMGGQRLRQGQRIGQAHERAEQANPGVLEFAEYSRLKRPWEIYFMPRTFCICIAPPDEKEFPFYLFELLSCEGAKNYGTVENKELGNGKPWHIEVCQYLSSSTAWNDKEDADFLELTWEAMGNRLKTDGAKSTKRRKKPEILRMSKMRLNWDLFSPSCLFWGFPMDILKKKQRIRRETILRGEHLKEKLCFSEEILKVLRTSTGYSTIQAHISFCNAWWHYVRDPRNDPEPEGTRKDAGEEQKPDVAAPEHAAAAAGGARSSTCLNILDL
jgi:hypothetical protein